MPSENTERIAWNESRFRAYNERVNAEDPALAAESDRDLRILCECGRSNCAVVLLLRARTYEEVRGSSRRFIVAPDHDAPSTERVVERAEAFMVVEKHADVSGIVESTDPRREA